MPRLVENLDFEQNTDDFTSNDSKTSNNTQSSPKPTKNPFSNLKSKFVFGNSSDEKEPNAFLEKIDNFKYKFNEYVNRGNKEKAIVLGTTVFSLAVCFVIGSSFFNTKENQLNNLAKNEAKKPSDVLIIENNKNKQVQTVDTAELARKEEAQQKENEAEDTTSLNSSLSDIEVKQKPVDTAKLEPSYDDLASSSINSSAKVDNRPKKEPKEFVMSEGKTVKTDVIVESSNTNVKTGEKTYRKKQDTTPFLSSEDTYVSKPNPNKTLSQNEIKKINQSVTNSSSTKRIAPKKVSSVRYTNNYQTSPNLAINGGIGRLSIPSIGLNCRVNNAPDLLDYGTYWDIPSLRTGVGHYPTTPTFDGTVGLAGHRGMHFKNLTKVNIGDVIYYNYQGQVRSYKVVMTKYIDSDDWQIFNNSTGSNELVLTTCERGSLTGRFMVKAVAIGEAGSSATDPHSEGEVATGDGYGLPIGSYAKKGDFRGRNGHKNDIVDESQNLIQDFYEDSGYNDPVDVFTGDVTY